jgi:hypothetical protein
LRWLNTLLLAGICHFSISSCANGIIYSHAALVEIAATNFKGEFSGECREAKKTPPQCVAQHARLTYD